MVSKIKDRCLKKLLIKKFFMRCKKYPIYKYAFWEAEMKKGKLHVMQFDANSKALFLILSCRALLR